MRTLTHWESVCRDKAHIFVVVSVGHKGGDVIRDLIPASLFASKVLFHSFTVVHELELHIVADLIPRKTGLVAAFLDICFDELSPWIWKDRILAIRKIIE